MEKWFILILYLQKHNNVKYIVYSIYLFTLYFNLKNEIINPNKENFIK